MFKKLGIVVAGCALSLVLGISASADTVSKGIVNADALNVRTMPTTESPAMGLLPTNYEVTVLGQQDNWYKIDYNGTEAYVCADYIIITQTDIWVEPTPLPQAPAISINPNAIPLSSGLVPSYMGSQIPGEILVEIAKQYICVPYVYGGMSPEGFDCSGFVKYCYSLMGADINRVACDQALNGIEIPPEQILPGDILCFADGISSGYIGHTGIYVGNGYFIHSPRTGYSVEILPLASTSYGFRIKNIRRIFY